MWVLLTSKLWMFTTVTVSFVSVTMCAARIRPGQYTFACGLAGARAFETQMRTPPVSVRGPGDATR